MLTNFYQQKLLMQPIMTKSWWFIY